MLTILYFGKLSGYCSEADQSLEFSIQVDSPTNIRQFLQQQSPLLSEQLCQSGISVAINQQMSNWDDSLQDGDEVAFLPVVTGG